MYNHRASMVQPTPRSTQQKKREEENSFMTLASLTRRAGALKKHPANLPEAR